MINFTPTYFIILCKIFLFIVSNGTHANQLQITTLNSTVKFSVTHIGKTTVYGKFNNFDGVLTLQNNKLTKAKGKIQVASIETNNKLRNKYLISNKFFNANENPYIRFYCDSFTVSGNQMIANGELNIYNVSQNILLTLKQDQTKQYFSTNHELNRFDYNLTRHKRMIGSTINIFIEFYTPKPVDL